MRNRRGSRHPSLICSRRCLRERFVGFQKGKSERIGTSTSVRPGIGLGGGVSYEVMPF